MPFQPAPDVVQLVARFLKDNIPIEVVLHAAGAAPATPTDVANLAAVMDLWAGSTILTGLPSDTVYQESIATALDNALAPQAANIAHAGAVGTAGGNPLPNQDTLALSFKTIARGRGSQGRIFWPGLSDGMRLGINLVTAGVEASLLGFMGTFATAVIAAGFNHVVLSRRHAGALRPSAIFFNVLSYAFTDAVIDAQRRRQPAHNRHR